MAINPGEDPKMQMFIWNNIFFSLGFDVRDHYKDLGGDAAAFVAPRNDLQGVKGNNWALLRFGGSNFQINIWCTFIVKFLILLFSP